MHFYQITDKDGKEFHADTAGEYIAKYYAETKSGNTAYTFTQKVIVKEKTEETEPKKETNKEKKEEKKEDADDSGSQQSAQKKTTQEQGTEQVTEEKTEAKSEVKSTEEATQAAPKETTEAPALEKSTFSATKADELSYNVLYVMKHGNKEYINTDAMDYSSMVFPVTVARGLATYNVKKQKEFDVNDNFIAGMTYELPVYDVDGNSDYYVAMPNVNLYSKELTAYDLTLIYNNDRAEHIDGYHYENNILYIPKKAVDDPQNEHPLYDGTPIAVQLNYAFGGIDADNEGNADFGKTLPVQILDSNSEKPESKSFSVQNVFSSEFTIPDVVKSSHGYEKDDFSVFLNGMLTPIQEDAWDYEDGNIVIYSPAATVSNVNIVYEGKSTISKALNTIKSSFGTITHATTTDNMKYYKNKKDKYVDLELTGKDEIFIGWRGYYNGKFKYPGTGENKPRDTDILNWLKDNADYGELKNSAYYLYGGAANGREVENNDAGWAIQSYCIGGDKTTGNTLSINENVYKNGDTSGGKKTIYGWFVWAQSHIEKAKGGWGGGRTTYTEGSNAAGTDEGNILGVKESGDESDNLSNGIGGSTNFAFKFPTGKVSGESRVLAPGHSKNIDIKFSADAFANNTFLAMGCTHFDEDGVGDASDDDNVGIYVACLDAGTDTNGQQFAVLAFTTASKIGNQEGCAVYKFRVVSKNNIKLKKKSKLSDITDGNALYASLAGAKYGVYPTQADAQNGTNSLGTLTTTTDGSTNEIEVAKGTYYIKELQPAPNYAINTEIKAVTVADEDVELDMDEIPQSQPVGIFLEKYDEEKKTMTPQGNGVLSGAEFTVKYFDDEAKRDAKTGELRTWVFKTDNNNRVDLQNPILVSGTLYKDSTGKNVFPIGYYSVEETKAPTGYHLPSVTEIKYQSFNITPNGVDENPGTFGSAKNVSEPVYRGGLSITKIDEETKGTDMEGRGQGDADLSGIKFNIINRSQNAVLVDGKNYNPGQVCKTIITDANGKASTGNHDLPYGKYEVVEVGADGLANNSYLLKNGNSRTKNVEQDGVVVEIEEKFENPVVRGDVQVEKLDIETKERVPLGKATHVGTTFEITNRSKAAVKVGEKWYQPGEVVATIKIEKEKEPAKTTGKALPYGTYSIKETAVGEGYLLTDTKERIFQIREDGKLVSISKTGDVKEPFENQVKRGNIHFDKKILDIEAGQNKGMKYVPFLITSKTTGEKHVVVTDVNGNFDTDGYKHSNKTNANDALLSEDGKSITDPSKLDYEAGVWFGQDREGNQTLKVDDELCALPYDDYTLTELSAPVNAGTKMITEDFTIYRDQQNIDRGTFNDINRPEIGTVAKDSVTNGNYGSNESEKIIDTVSYKGLTPGEEYTMKGELMDKATEEVIVVDGKKITATKKFTPEAANGEVEIEFTFPKGALAGKEVVAFETCKLAGRVVVTHEDIEDASQTVIYPGIETEFVDGQTKTHYGYNDSTTIVVNSSCASH